VVNRLDRDTSGIVLAAKHRQAARELGLIFDRREVDKEYLSIVSGWPDADDWTCDAPILRAGELGPSPIWVRQIAHSAGKPCLTRFRVEQRFTRAEGRFSLVRCFPETGRMHQIRVHLAHAGFPIVGDKLYTGDGAAYLAWMDTGWTEELRQSLLLPRHALHAAKLSLPWNGRLLEWRSDLPEDLTAFIAGRPHCPPPGIELWSRHDRSAETPAELRPSAEMLPSAPPRG
jgi:23S rRNA pseudouridine1911/1915/1917 synthase